MWVLRLLSVRMVFSRHYYRAAHNNTIGGLCPRWKPLQQHRQFGSSSCLRHDRQEWEDPRSPEEVVNVTFVDQDSIEHKVKAKVGDNVLYLAHRYDIDLEGACEASCACCTCHVYVEDGYFERLPEPKEEEEDMLDLAPFLQDNSRLGCQITLSKDMDGIRFALPRATRNFYVDGHVPKPH